MNALACRFADALARLCSNVWMVPASITACIVAWLVRAPTDPFNTLVSDVSLVLLFVLARSGKGEMDVVTEGVQVVRDGVKEVVRALPDADDHVMAISEHPLSAIEERRS